MTYNMIMPPLPLSPPAGTVILTIPVHQNQNFGGAHDYVSTQKSEYPTYNQPSQNIELIMLTQSGYVNLMSSESDYD